MTIGDYAFNGCSGLTSITIPDSVMTIGDSAFASCNRLTSVTIPNSVTKMGYDVFGEFVCLASITYSGTISDWQTNFEEKHLGGFTPNYTVYCTDGTITKDGTITYN
jgi:hypothetical protein